MSFHSLLIHDVTVFNRVAGPGTGTDSVRYGDEEFSFDAGTAVIARVDERSTTENDLDQEGRQKTYLVFFEPTVAVSAQSYLMWNSHELRVEGEPQVKFDDQGAHHIEADCKEVLG